MAKRNNSADIFQSQYDRFHSMLRQKWQNTKYAPLFIDKYHGKSLKEVMETLGEPHEKVDLEALKKEFEEEFGYSSDEEIRRIMSRAF